MYFKRFGMSDETELVAVGHTPEWNKQVLAALGLGLPYINHLSLHRYFRRGRTAEFTEEEYTKLMQDTGAFETEIRTAIAAIKEIEPVREKIPVFGQMKLRPVGVVIDEWGVWDDESTPQNRFRQNGPLREALFAASCLNLFHRYCDRISMTNIAQSVNVLQALILTDGPTTVLTPTFHVYRMYVPHHNGVSIRTELQDDLPLSASASKSNGSVFLTVVNPSQTQDAEVEVSLVGAKPVRASATNLTAESVRTQNTRDQPNAISPREWKVSMETQAVRLNVPAKSVQAISISLK